MLIKIMFLENIWNEHVDIYYMHEILKHAYIINIIQFNSIQFVHYCCRWDCNWLSSRLAFCNSWDAFWAFIYNSWILCFRSLYRLSDSYVLLLCSLWTRFNDNSYKLSFSANIWRWWDWDCWLLPKKLHTASFKPS